MIEMLRELSDRIFKDWEVQLFWALVTVVAIPMILHLHAALQKKNQAAEEFNFHMRRLDISVYLGHWVAYFSFLRACSLLKLEDIHKYDRHDIMRGFETVSRHMYDVLASMKEHIKQMERSSSARDIKALTDATYILGLFQTVIRARELSIIGPGALLDSAGDMAGSKQLSLHVVLSPANTIAELMSRHLGKKSSAAIEAQNAISENSQLIADDIDAQMAGYTMLTKLLLREERRQLNMS